MSRHISSRLYGVLPIAVKIFAILIVGTVGTMALFGQTCTVSPDSSGGPQYNQPRGRTQNAFGQTVAVAWPKGYKVYYIEYVGLYNTYPTSFPNDYVGCDHFRLK
jgi:hypothetical protein